MEKLVYEYMGSDRGNCSTAIVGKNASVTGKVLLAHNEDDTEAVVQTHLVPRIKHKPGTVITFADASAVIPQVEETYAYYWSEVRCEGGISFADGFVNEFGVAVVSNACRPSKDATGSHSDNREAYGIGYGIRRLVAERAKTAREGVKVIAELVEKFGYFSSRSYQVVDKDEAWVVQVPKGFNVVAQRVGDDEVYYIPNWYTIHKIDLNDKDNFYASPNLIPHAIQQGWYAPAVEGDWSDFDFALTYQEGEKKQYNLYRARNAWRILKGIELGEDEITPFSMKADKKYSADDLKQVMRSHYLGTPDDETEGLKKNPHRGYYSPLTICNPMTVESIVVEFNEDINLTRMLRAAPKGCVSPYTPWYPVALTRIPKGYNWMSPQASQAAHFFVDNEELVYSPEKAFWAFKVLLYFTEFDYKGTHAVIEEEIAKLEKAWEVEKDAIEGAYKALKAVDEDAAKEYLTQYTCAQAQKSWDWAHYMISKLGEARIMDNCKVWNDGNEFGE
ncbi:MAG: C69 family dipeptidase [Oscillospiraceae bacterium]|nr:C69 family dipeptidase [Oscillospiraceae bacterium]